MDLKQSQILSHSNIQSTIGSQSVMRPKSGTAKKSLNSGLALTALIDCFTVLVIYLLVATSLGGEELTMPKDLILPEASHSTALEKGVVILVQDGKYSVDNKQVSLENLSELLRNSRGNADSVVIQADKRANYFSLNPVVLSSLQAGFKKIKFAVLQGDKG